MSILTNAINANSTTPLSVMQGGNGVSNSTAYMPITGGTTSTGAYQSVSTAGASAGYVLTYVSSSALPTWQVAGAGIAWANYTPTITVAGGTAPTYTGGAIARWTQVGKTVTVNIQFYNSSGGTAGSGSGQIVISLPTTAGASAGNGVLSQFGYFLNSPLEGMVYSVVNSGATTIPLYYFNTIATTAQLTGTLQNNAIRQIGLYFSYETA